MTKDTWNVAHRLWRASAMSNSKPEDYLRARGINLVPESLKLISSAESLRVGLRRFPTIIAPVAKEGHLIGVQVTALTMDERQKVASNADRARMSFGKVSGGFVQLGAIDSQGPLVVGEGIESALSAMQLSGASGIAALSAGNMARLRPPMAAQYVIAADNDDPGRKAALALAERLKYEGHQALVVVPEGTGTDWNDVLRKGKKAAAKAWDAAFARAELGEPMAPISALAEAEFMELAFPKRALLLEQWLPRPGLAMVYAPKGEGKTWFALAVGKAVASGDGLLGWHCPNYGRVLYVEGELPGQSVQNRLSKFRRSPPDMFHVLCRDTFLLRRETMPDLGEPEGRQELDRIIERCKPALIIIDTISTMVRSGIENEAESWAPIQAWLLDQRWQGRTVILMHHSGKSGKQRGTSKREDVMDTIIALKKQPDLSTDTESVFDLTFDKSRDFFGKAAEPMRLRFSINGGQANWTGGPLRDTRKEQVRDMLREGMKKKDVAQKLGVTPGRISQIVKELGSQLNGIEFPARPGGNFDETV